jgi:hypothetical protein
MTRHTHYVIRNRSEMVAAFLKVMGEVFVMIAYERNSINAYDQDLDGLRMIRTLHYANIVFGTFMSEIKSSHEDWRSAEEN